MKDSNVSFSDYPHTSYDRITFTCEDGYEIKVTRNKNSVTLEEIIKGNAKC